MNLGELRKQLEDLQDLPDETLLVMSSDAEGNTIRPLHAIGNGYYLQTGRGQGEFLTDPAELEGDPRVEFCLAFWPV